MRYLKLWGVALFAVALPVFTNGQESDSTKAQHLIGIQFGVNQIKEENLHPKVSTGTITMLGYGLEKQKKSWHQFHFAVGYSRLKTKLEDLSKTINLRLTIDYSWNYPLINSKSFRYHLGAAGSIAYNVCYFPNWDDSHLYWGTFYSTGINNTFSLHLKNENDWVTFISLPLFSVLSRPEINRLYKIDDTDFAGIISNMNSEIIAAHLVNVFYIRFQTEYRFPVFKLKRQAFIYAFEYNRIQHPDGNIFSQISHQVGFKFFL